MKVIFERKNLLFIILGGFFITNALLAEFLGVKIFSLEQTFGLDPAEIKILGFDNLSFNLTTGVLLWPVVFVMTDVINEYYGRRGVKILSFLAAGLILYGFLMIFLAINLSPADFWINRETAEGVLNMDLAYNEVFGQGLWIITGSLTAFVTGQLVDVGLFHAVKRSTGEKMVWLRATGSTLVSQLIDSFIVLFIAFYIGAGWSFKLVLAIAVINYLYKAFMAILLTPVIYLAHWTIDSYLGKQVAEDLKSKAAGAEPDIY